MPLPVGVKVTVLFPGVTASKSVPVTLKVVGLAGRFAVFRVTVGGGLTVTVATCTALPLVWPLVVTTA
jgi:hypothetical protein